MPRNCDLAMPGCTGNTARAGCAANGLGSKPKRGRPGQGCGPTRIQRPRGSGGAMKKGHRRRAREISAQSGSAAVLKAIEPGNAIGDCLCAKPPKTFAWRRKVRPGGARAVPGSRCACC